MFPGLSIHRPPRGNAHGEIQALH